jgi:hypothetical protein
VEHIILLGAKPNISDAEEKDMLDYLYTSQYQMRGILTISLGERLISTSTAESIKIMNFSLVSLCGIFVCRPHRGAK